MGIVDSCIFLNAGGPGGDGAAIDSPRRAAEY